MAKIRALFFNRRDHTHVIRTVKCPSGGVGRDVAMMIACTDHAFDNDFTHWIQQDKVVDPTCYRVFACMGRSKRAMIKEMPTKEAAIMWLVHAKSV